MLTTALSIALGVIVLFTLFKSIHKIDATDIGLVQKRLAIKKLGENDPIAFRGEAGFQAELLMPGLRWKLWPIYGVTKHPWVQVPAGEVGLVIAQVGQPLPIGAKSAVYRSEFGNFLNLEQFMANGGQKGVQRPVMPPGTLAPIHPIAFVVLTKSAVYGVPVSPELKDRVDESGMLVPETFGLMPEQLSVTVIAPEGEIDRIGIITALEGDPLPASDIASRLGGFRDVAEMEEQGSGDPEIIEMLLSSKNSLHNNYQDFQAFLDNGGRIGLQHDPLLYGAYLLNPFLVRVDMVPMLVVQQGEVAVIKAYVGETTADTSGDDFKFGSLVRPGHRGIWQEPLRTGKYPINPRCYAAERVPTAILTLNWADAESSAHNLDRELRSIEAKSREGFVFSIDLQVQIHVPDTRAPNVISMVGTMMNLVNEVLQSAVGNHFRDRLQALPAVAFIETRQQVQQEAFAAIKGYLGLYLVETKGVFIQDVAFPEALVDVLTRREIANQEKATYDEQQRAQTARIEMEKAKGTADMQAELAQAQVGVDIKKNDAAALEAEATGKAAFTRLTGEAEATRIQAIGLANAKATEAIGIARARGYTAQREALGETSTALVNAFGEIAQGDVKIVPEVLVTGGNGSLDALAATLVQKISNDNGTSKNGKEKALANES